MRGMFTAAASFNQLMFAGTTTFEQPIGEWGVSHVEDMQQMFEQATTFNQPIVFLGICLV